MNAPERQVLPAMVSYAQNAEDVVLRRVFADVEHGFYVDVGACVPVEDSVTFHFYEHGWSGVNIEPDPRFYDELAEARARDVNLNVAVGSAEGLVTFYPAGIRGQGTLNPRVAAERSGGLPVQVEQISLRRVLSEYAPPQGVDFLKVDVEGWEAEVIASTNWRDVRPRVVVVEAVDPEGRPTHEEWEERLLAAGYRYALFDGLNRFYCREEDEDRFLPRLAAPANLFDNWRTVREVQEQAALEVKLSETGAARVALEAKVAQMEAVHSTLEGEHASARAALEAEQAAHAETQASAGVALEAEQAAHAETQASAGVALEAEQAAHAETRRILEIVLTSTSWSVTAPLRDLSRRAKGLLRRLFAGRIRPHADEVIYAGHAPSTSIEADPVFGVTGVPAQEILRRCAALRAKERADVKRPTRSRNNRRRSRVGRARALVGPLSRLKHGRRRQVSGTSGRSEPTARRPSP